MWFVILTQPRMGGEITANVMQYRSVSAAERATGETGLTSYPTRAAAQKVADKYNHQPASKRQQDVNPNIPVGTAAGGTSSLDKIASFFQGLTQANTWLRVGEVLLGIVLLGIGLARITGTQNLVSSAVKARI